jgi:hypothetical protein
MELCKLFAYEHMFDFWHITAKNDAARNLTWNGDDSILTVQGPNTPEMENHIRAICVALANALTCGAVAATITKS